MSPIVSIDGRSVPAEGPHLSVFDHGFLYGDSVYEVCRTYGGRLFAFREHMDRLRRSAAAIDLEIPDPDDWYGHEMNRLIVESGHPECYARIIVTRGDGPITFDPEVCAVRRRIVIVDELHLPPDAWYTEGARIALVDVRRNDRRTVPPGIKTGNYLNSVLAFIEAKRRGAVDAIMLNLAGHLTEGTASNLWFVRQGVLCTPGIDAGILGGITRALLIGLCREEGIPVIEAAFPPEALWEADEAFLTSTTREMLPVVRVDGQVIGSGRPGPIAARLRRLWQEKVIARHLWTPPPGR